MLKKLCKEYYFILAKTNQGIDTIKNLFVFSFVEFYEHQREVNFHKDFAMYCEKNRAGDVILMWIFEFKRDWSHQLYNSNFYDLLDFLIG